MAETTEALTAEGLVITTEYSSGISRHLTDLGEMATAWLERDHQTGEQPTDVLLDTDAKGNAYLGFVPPISGERAHRLLSYLSQEFPALGIAQADQVKQTENRQQG